MASFSFSKFVLKQILCILCVVLDKKIRKSSGRPFSVTGTIEEEFEDLGNQTTHLTSACS
ncbi:hypothetical protein GBA52_027226 [Prunus armeniaca]|nr:hypothetical protein GBA52_027226 [Prunus armeniaca]